MKATLKRIYQNVCRFSQGRLTALEFKVHSPYINMYIYHIWGHLIYLLLCFALHFKLFSYMSVCIWYKRLRCQRNFLFWLHIPCTYVIVKKLPTDSELTLESWWSILPEIQLKFYLFSHETTHWSDLLFAASCLALQLVKSVEYILYVAGIVMVNSD